MGNSSSSSSQGRGKPRDYDLSFDTQASEFELPPPYSQLSELPEAIVPQRQNRYSSRSRRAAHLRTPMRQRSVEDALEILRKYDTIFIIDDSSSMVRLWGEVRHALSELAATAGKYDMTGIDVYFLNSTKTGLNLKTTSAVCRLFDRIIPNGITPMGDKLEELLHDYLSKIEAVQNDRSKLKQIKPMNYIVITDGAPTDDPESVIVDAARRLDAGKFSLSQLGIQFVQIGCSQEAHAYLEELDEALSERHKIRDIVDTTLYSDTGGMLNQDVLIKILVGGINRRVDKADEGHR